MRQLIKKLHNVFNDFQTKLEYSRCYSANEDTGNATMGLCECDDLNCPHNCKKHFCKLK